MKKDHFLCLHSESGGDNLSLSIANFFADIVIYISTGSGSVDLGEGKWERREGEQLQAIHLTSGGRG